MAVEDQRNSGPLEADVTDDRVSSSRKDVVAVSVNYSAARSVTERSAIQVLKRLSFLLLLLLIVLLQFIGNCHPPKVYSSIFTQWIHHRYII